jgi:predicted DNA-binding transcriptional regulator
VIDLVVAPALFLFVWSASAILIYNGLVWYHEQRRIREINKRVDDLLKDDKDPTRKRIHIVA